MINNLSSGKTLLLAVLSISVAGAHAAAPPVAANTGFHYVLAQPNMAVIMPVCTRLQKDLNNFLINKNTLRNVGLSKSTGCVYQDTDFNQLKPHISLLQIPSTWNTETLAGQAKGCLKTYPKMPTAFTFKKIEAFLPTPGTTRIFIVARTSSNQSYGFLNLSQYLEHQLGFQNQHPWFLGHISLGTLTTQNAGGFTQADVNKLNAQLAHFTNMPQGNYAIDAIILSPYKQNRIIRLWQ